MGPSGPIKEMTNYEIDQPYGIFMVDRIDDTDKNVYVKLLGSIAYLDGTEPRYQPKQLIFITQLDSIEIKDYVSIFPVGEYSDKYPMALYGLLGGGAQNLVISDAIGISGKRPYYHIVAEWQKTNVSGGATLAEVLGEGVSIFTSNIDVCYRYQDGVLTDVPLWPWPMNQRIIDAMIQSGREPVDVTATIEKIFGPISIYSKPGTPELEVKH